MTTRALATVMTLLLLALVPAPTIQAATHETVPSANFSFMPTLQTFLQNEDAARYADLYSSVVVSGGIHSTAAGLVGSPTALVAYLGGYYTTESGTITYPDESICHIIAHKDTTANQGSYTRVAGTHYLINCGAIATPALPPAIPNVNSVLLMTVTTTGGAITAVVDRRPLGNNVGFDACRYTTLNDAVTALGSTMSPFIVGCFLRSTTNLTIPATANVIVTNAGQLCPDTSTTLTINAQISAADHKIFCSGFGAIAIGRGSHYTLPVEWWGVLADDSTDNRTALQFVADSMSIGGTLTFHCGRYKSNGNVTFVSRINLIGAGIECTQIINTSTTGADLFTFSDTVTSQDEYRFGRVANISFVGNSLSGNGLVINNPYHFYIDWVRVEQHGGIGIDVQKGFGGSTYGQNVFIDHAWITTNLKGGVRFNRPNLLTSGGNIVSVRHSSINQNGYYGIYLNGVSQGVISNNELGDYYYGALIAAHQAVPIVLLGGAAIEISDNSFENNGGTGSVANYHIRTGYNGDDQTEAEADSDTQMLTIRHNDFKANISQNSGDINHVKLRSVLNVLLYQNFFEKETGYADNVYGVEFATGVYTYGSIVFNGNDWSEELDGHTTGAYYGNYIWMDSVTSATANTRGLAYGIHSSDDADLAWWQLRSNDTENNFQVMGSGSIKMGSGAVAPAEVLSRQTLTLQSTGFLALGTPSDGAVKYCSDCTFANPCASGGSGAIAKRLNGAWRCD